MHILSLYFKHSKWLLFLATALGIVSGLTTAALLACINHALQNPNWVSHDVVIFGSLCILRLVSGVLAHYILISMSQRSIMNIRLDLCQRTLDSSLSEIELAGKNKLFACFSDDVMDVSTAVINLPYFFVNIIVLLGCLAYLGMMSIPMCVGLGVCFALGILSYTIPIRIAMTHLKNARESQDDLFARFDGIVSGVKELKLHEQKRNDYLLGALYRSADSVRKNNIMGIGIYATAANWNRLLFFVYVGVIIYASPTIVTDINLALLSSYVLVLLYMMAPLEAIQNALPHIAKANVALQKSDSLGLTSSEKTKPDDFKQTAFDHWKAIGLYSLCRQYNHQPSNESFTLGPINLVLHRGEVLFITGGNGSGKTTLAKVLAGLYCDFEGKLTVDEQDISESNIHAYRSLYSAVFSDFHLFDEIHGITEEAINRLSYQYLKDFDLSHKLKIQDGKLSTTALSSGQRKRVALLIAMMENRDVYILDEWAADQDPTFRETFYHKIIPDLKAQGKTLVVISHDDRYYHLADRLIKLDCGVIETEFPGEPDDTAAEYDVCHSNN